MLLTTFTPSTSAIGDSVALSALLGIFPLIVFFVMLGVFKLATHWCALGSLIVAFISAVVGFSMPVSLAGLSILQGAAFGIAPIIYIVIAAVWLYNLTVTSGRAEDVRLVFSAVGKGDIRIQALLVAFSFCGLLEGLAGFGAPVAIVAAMLVTLGLSPLKAAVTTMVGNAINVGFGAMAIPMTTAGRLGGVAGTEVGATASSITPWIATFVPLLLLAILDGKRGLKELWLVALVQGVVTSIGHIVAANYISYELTAVFASLLGFGVTAAILTKITPQTPAEFRSHGLNETSNTGKLDAGRITLALMPYWLVVIIFAIAKLWRFGIDIPQLLASTDKKIEWPGLYGQLLTPAGEVSSSPIYNLQTLSSPGTMIVLTALIVSFVYGKNSSNKLFEYSFGRGIRTLVDTVVTLKLSLLTIALVMSLAYVMNFSGQTVAIGAALAATGSAFAFLSPILGWIGTAVTGSATSSNALFANLQATAAHGASLDPGILLSANSIGGGIGKIVSPQNLAIASTAVGKVGSEPEILRKVAPWSIGLLIYLCTVVFLATQGIIPTL
ncbi:lactate permease [Arcanobacterium pluranimalium]|uniref:L-lactate permease n=1 Tax=Arcanobacterium pluranimalium TaxID=108028 RepID=UPI00195CDFE8|nr:L-lactate permease [Arcanobacterium pluranimalium]MBM7825517.1 lactate permease [Arcanobacterium pluranimalium]